MSIELYDPSIFFAPRNRQEAQQIILTAEDSTTDHRWATETPYFVDLMLDHIPLDADSTLLDYGCGIGRLSKELIARTQCWTYGVDISPVMLALASEYVQHSRFLACAPEMMMRLPKVDAIVLVWVLQHIRDPEAVIRQLITMLKPNGRVFIANSYVQVLPISNRRWHFGDLDVLELTRKHLRDVTFSDGFDPIKTTPGISNHGWWGVFEQFS